MTKIEYADIDSLYLDPTNPRLGRKVAASDLLQSSIMDVMQDWTLDELVLSFIESGFWPQEALIVVKEKLYGSEKFVVVEGNRRLAALKFLQQAVSGEPKSKKWLELVANKTLPDDLLRVIPYIEVPSRAQVSAYLGFRHVTGIKEWNPAEKAQYIAKLIEEENLSYDDVRRKIGSKTPAVRSHYISYRLLLQMDNEENVSIDKVEDKFSVLYLSLRTQGVQKYLHIDIQATPEKALRPVPQEHIQNLINYSQWLFGTDKKPPLFTDSRNVDSFGKILESEEAVQYLESTEEPRYELAYKKAGVGEQDVISLISAASDNIQVALSEVHLFKTSEKIQKVVTRLGQDAIALINVFPHIKESLKKELIENASSP